MWEDAGKVWGFIKNLWTKFAESWAAMTVREKLWSVATVAGTGFGILAGGIVPGAVVTGVITAGAIAWLVSYSGKAMVWLEEHSAKFDWAVTVTCLVALFFVGANLGLMLVFVHLWTSFGLAVLRAQARLKPAETKEIEVQATTVAA